ncbi:DUF4386 domain-containing protein [Halobacillus salinus]|uniref:DUF4386 domain-containing protein n=1 Tax=Halobacillus salinus TaxID=192814 RepID=UPI001590D76D|nr:DUF4386 domain-containing protein [Halobacillus salinus]
MSFRKVSQRTAALVAGISLLVMTLAAFFSYGYVHSALVVADDASATWGNIQASLGLFRLGIAGWGVIVVTDLLVSWAFYRVLEPVHKRMAQVVGGLRLLYTLILAVAVFQLVMADVRATDASQLMASIESFEAIWSFGLIVFGAHLVMTGLTALRAAYIPRILGWSLIAGGAGYTLVHSLYQVFPQWDTTTATIETFGSVPMMAGELAFGLWLLVKAIRAKRALPASWLGAS